MIFDLDVKIGKAVLKNIRENLFLAFICNVICIPIAAGLPYVLGFGEFTHIPMVAAAAMACSSLCVTQNSLRLNAMKFSVNEKKVRAEARID